MVVRDVVRVAVVNLKAPPSASISSVALAHDLALVSVALAATAINQPPEAIEIDPVVSGSVESMSVDLSAPVEE